MRQACLALLLACVAQSAPAAVYKYVDADGNVTFSDHYRPGAVKFLDTRDGGTIRSTPRKRGGVETPADFPRVDARTQSRRDDVRRSLLLDERKNEENALAAVRSQIDNGKARTVAEREKLDESRRLHEKNIEMLDKELARIK
ncbi:DUF4124 domain-containing protein [Parasulfuritortus cantonensis]|nr:DUF4124 domain-containing protein [Parasulfuritortus cantonensis]